MLSWANAQDRGVDLRIGAAARLQPKRDKKVSRCEDGTFTVVTGGLNRPTSLEFIGDHRLRGHPRRRDLEDRRRLRLALRRHALSNRAWAADHLAGNHGATTTGSAGFPDCRVAPADPKWDLTGARRQQPERSRAGYRLVSQAAWVRADPSGSGPGMR